MSSPLNGSITLRSSPRQSLSRGPQYLKPLDSRLKTSGMTEEADSRLNFGNDGGAVIPECIRTIKGKNIPFMNPRDCRTPRYDSCNDHFGGVLHC